MASALWSARKGQMKQYENKLMNIYYHYYSNDGDRQRGY